AFEARRVPLGDDPLAWLAVQARIQFEEFLIARLKLHSHLPIVRAGRHRRVAIPGSEEDRDLCSTSRSEQPASCFDDGVHGAALTPIAWISPPQRKVYHDESGTGTEADAAGPTALDISLSDGCEMRPDWSSQFVRQPQVFRAKGQDSSGVVTSHR